MQPSSFDSASPVPRFSVSEFLAITNQTLNYAFPKLELVGEVSSFKVSKGKWVFFDLKDASGTVSCFLPLFSLRTALEDGMKVLVSGAPKVTDFGKFSFTVQSVRPLGEGSLKKAFDLLKDKLMREGLFAPEKKRPLPEDLTTLGVISSVNAAGYADFIKILDARWGGLDIRVYNCGVQGASAADELIRALDYFNEQGTVDAIALLRGGGSKDDLAVFNDELLVRRIAASKIPVITGIGHEVDVSLADLAADVRASTPSNAAELLTRDKSAELRRLRGSFSSLKTYLDHYLSTLLETRRATLARAEREILSRLSLIEKELASKRAVLDSLNPENVLRQGYSILTGDPSPGNVVKITTFDKLISAKVTHVQPKI